MEKTTHYEKTLTSEVLFEGRVITLTKDTALLENGKTATREVVHHHGGACIVPYFADGTICMVRQFRYAMQQELWELPAGKLEKGEDPFEAAKRELEEECGLTADKYTSLGEFFPTVGYDTEVIYTWVATGLHETHMHLDDDEFLTPDRVPLEKAYEMVMSGEIKDGKTIAGILKLKVNISQLRLVKQPDKPKPQPTSVHLKTGAMERTVRMECDVRGMALDEAIMTVDQYLDQAILAGMGEVSIIHGKGTGVLRSGIQQHLKHHMHVASCRLGVYGEGESGVTIVTLK